MPRRSQWLFEGNEIKDYFFLSQCNKQWEDMAIFAD